MIAEDKAESIFHCPTRKDSLRRADKRMQAIERANFLRSSAAIGNRDEGLRTVVLCEDSPRIDRELECNSLEFLLL